MALHLASYLSSCQTSLASDNGIHYFMKNFEHAQLPELNNSIQFRWAVRSANRAGHIFFLYRVLASYLHRFKIEGRLIRQIFGFANDLDFTDFSETIADELIPNLDYRVRQRTYCQSNDGTISRFYRRARRANLARIAWKCAKCSLVDKFEMLPARSATSFPEIRQSELRYQNPAYRFYLLAFGDALRLRGVRADFCRRAFNAFPEFLMSLVPAVPANGGVRTRSQASAAMPAF